MVLITGECRYELPSILPTFLFSGSTENAAISPNRKDAGIVSGKSSVQSKVTTSKQTSRLVRVPVVSHAVSYSMPQVFRAGNFNYWCALGSELFCRN